MADVVIPKAHPSDGFVASTARWIRDEGRRTYQANADSWGASRHLSACELLAKYVETLPLWDVRFRLLLRVSRDSDYFSPAGNVKRFIALLGVDVPAPADPSAVFNEFCAEATAGLAPGLADSEKQALKAEAVAARAQNADQIEALEREVALRDKEIAKRDQELSDLRGRLKAVDAADYEKLESENAQLRRELDASPKKSKTKATA